MVLFCFGLLPLIHNYSLQALASDLIDGVTVKGTNVYTIRGEDLEVVTNSVTLPFEVEVTTNGTFTVASGKERNLSEGQIIRNDGWLVSPEGHLEPIVNHVAAVAGRVILRRDGYEEVLTEQMVFPNGLIINPNGSCTYPSGSPSRLADGQLFRFDGKTIPAMDAATLINGKVMVQKDGTLIFVSPQPAFGTAPLAIGMPDGTLVKADGTVRHRDGSITVLREGHTVLIQGTASRY
jgi:hypothetical protein